MNNKQLISVIIPVYNVEKYLDRCMESVVNQTYTDTEILLINDGSTDQSLNICQKWQKKDKRIKIISKKNGGLSDARNTGLNIARGELLTFIDSDDWIHIKYLEILYEMQRKYQSDIAIANFAAVFDKIPAEKKKNKMKIYNNREALENLLYQREISTSAWGKLFKKNLLKGIYFPIGKLYEDVEFIYYVLERCEKIIYTDQPLYYYYQREDSIIRKSFTKNKMDYIYSCELIYKDVVEKHSEIANAAISRLLWAKIHIIAQICNPHEFPTEYEKAWENIDFFRSRVLFDKKSRFINKFLLLFTFKKNFLLNKMYLLHKKFKIFL